MTGPTPSGWSDRANGETESRPSGHHREHGDLLPRLPIVAMVLAAEDIDLGAEPEEGKPGEIAAALDALADAERRAKEAEKAAAQAGEHSEKRLKEVLEAQASGADEEVMMGMEAAAREARERAERAARRAAKAAVARAQEATRAAEALGVRPVKGGEEPEEVPDPKNGEGSGRGEGGE